MRPLLFLVIAISLSACVVSKEWAASGGSRADGVVRLSYTYHVFESPETDDNQAMELARTRCAAWGYPDAEPFGMSTERCNDRDCNVKLVTLEYQCMGK